MTEISVMRTSRLITRIVSPMGIRFVIGMPWNRLGYFVSRTNAAVSRSLSAAGSRKAPERRSLAEHPRDQPVEQVRDRRRDEDREGDAEAGLEHREDEKRHRDQPQERQLVGEGEVADSLLELAGLHGEYGLISPV